MTAREWLKDDRLKLGIEALGPYCLGLGLAAHANGWLIVVGGLLFLGPYNWLRLSAWQGWRPWALLLLANLPLMALLTWFGGPLAGICLGVILLLLTVRVAPLLGLWDHWAIRLIMVTICTGAGPFVAGMVADRSTHLYPWLALGLGVWGAANYLFDAWPSTRHLQILTGSLYLVTIGLGILMEQWVVIVLGIYLLACRSRSEQKRPTTGSWWLVHWLAWGWLSWWLIWTDGGVDRAFWASLGLLGVSIIMAWQSIRTSKRSLPRRLAQIGLLHFSVIQVAKIGQPEFRQSLRADLIDANQTWGTDLPNWLLGLSAGLALLLPYWLIWHNAVLTNLLAPLVLLAAIIVQLVAYIAGQPRVWTVITYPLLLLAEVLVLGYLYAARYKKTAT